METTATSLGYMNSTTSQPNQQYDTVYEDNVYDDTVNNFGMAFAVSSTAFSQLTNVNKKLGQHVASNVINLKTQGNNLTAMI